MHIEPTDPKTTPPADLPVTDAGERLRGNQEYGEDVNVGNLHGTVLREKDEPVDGLEPIPLWLVLVCGLLIFWGGAYLFRFSGGFDPQVYDENLVAYGPVSGGGAAAKTVDPIAVGKRLYTVNCSSCHQATGQGAAGQYPPLAGADLVLGKAPYGDNHLAKIMLHGLAGPISVSGGGYNGNMPAWASNLKDEQIAYILTFVRQEWGNKAAPVPAEAIAAIRKEDESRSNSWTDEELKKIPAKSLAAAPAANAPASAKGAASAPDPAKK